MTSEDLAILAEDILDYLNAQESAIVNLRMRIEKLVGSKETKAQAEAPQDRTKLPFDVSKITWQDRENEKGKFQVSEDYDSIDHRALLKFLTEHAGGCINSKDAEGNTYFYWVYTSGSKIGRKLKKAKANV